MEEKKTKWYYTTGGKIFRGFLCLVTFAVLVAGCVFILEGEAEFGMKVFGLNTPVYYNTTSYAGDVVGSLSDVMESISTLQNYTSDRSLRIISSGEIREYTLPSGEAINEATMKDLSAYLEEAEACTANFASFNGAVAALEKEKDSYIYFDKDSFKSLFMRCGELNTDYEFSDIFSENSYFVFNENGDGCAVYDAESDLYYSSWDDYFEPYDSYFYRCQDILNAIESSGEEHSIIIPMLWCDNLSLSDVVNDKMITAEEAEGAKETLANLKDGSFVYYIDGPTYTYTNVDSLDEVVKLNYSYRVVGADCQYDMKGRPKANLEVQDLLCFSRGYSEEEELVNSLPLQDMVAYFGMDYTRPVSLNSTDYLYQRYRLYNMMAVYGTYVIALEAVAFILLLLQAVWLIQTTGRREKPVTLKKRKKLSGEAAGENGRENAANPVSPAASVELYAYDNFPTELWFVVSLVILLLSLSWVEIMFSRSSVSDVIWDMGMAVVSALPFGFCFMVLTLSFARRIKAGNLRNHFFLGKHLNGFGKRLKGLGKKLFHRYHAMDVELRVFIFALSYVAITMLCIFLISLLGGLWFICMLVIVALNLYTAKCLRQICKDLKSINGCVEQIKEGDLDSKCEVKSENSLFAELADGINHMGDGLKAAVELSLKDERMKTELITNVSHDLKTPLTSIINYVDLLKKEDIQGENARHYLEVLDAKSQRLKQLTEDLVEAAKANSGNIELECMPLAFDELMRQAMGEFEDKFTARNLTVVATYPETPAVIMGDGRRIYRIIENLLQNAYKYALEGTRIYADLSNGRGEVAFTLKNVSAAQLNISPEELMERFTRGDESRTTEGSGLGLSIAKDLTRLMEGSFEIGLDGDLFKVIVTFPEYVKEDRGEN